MRLEGRAYKIKESKKPVTDLYKNMAAESRALLRIISELEEGRYGYEGISNGGESRAKSGPPQEDIPLNPQTSTEDLQKMIDELPTVEEVKEEKVDEPHVIVMPKSFSALNPKSPKEEEVLQNISIDKKDEDAPKVEAPKEEPKEEEKQETLQVTEGEKQKVFKMPETFENFMMNDFNSFVHSMERKYGERYIADMTFTEYNTLLKKYCDAYMKTHEEAVEYLSPFRNELTTSEVRRYQKMLQECVDKLKRIEETIREQSEEEQQEYMDLYNRLKEIYNKPDKDRSSVPEIKEICNTINEFASRYGRKRK